MNTLMHALDYDSSEVNDIKHTKLNRKHSYSANLHEDWLFHAPTG